MLVCNMYKTKCEMNPIVPFFCRSLLEKVLLLFSFLFINFTCIEMASFCFESLVKASFVFL